MSLYYEAHITIEPVFDERLDKFKEICRIWGFRVADLLMQKRRDDAPERSKHDSFCTGRDPSLDHMIIRVSNLVDTLQEFGFQVWRYKIEDTVIDSQIVDSFNKLKKDEECTTQNA